MKYSYKLACALFAAFISINAHAITIDYSLSNPEYISGSSNYSGTFNLADSLDSNLYTSPFSINSAYLTFNFSDDTIDQGFVKEYSTGSQSGWSIWRYTDNFIGTDYWYRQYSNYTESTYKNEQERAAISLSSGSASLSGSTSATNSTYSTDFVRGQEGYTNSLGVKTITSYCASSSFYSGTTYYECTKTGNAYEYIYDYDLNRYYDSSADRSLNWGIYGDVLDGFMETGLLTFDVSSMLGDFMLAGISLTLDINETPYINETSTSVPEPSTILLMGLGLLGFGVARRKQCI